MQLTIYVELVAGPHRTNPGASYRSRVLLKDEDGYGRAVLALGEPCRSESDAHESAIRTYERSARP